MFGSALRMSWGCCLVTGDEGRLIYFPYEPNVVCHGYCWMVHIHSVDVGSKHDKACLWNDYLCAKCTMFVTVSMCVARHVIFVY